MKISTLLIVSLFAFSMNLVSAKETSPLMLTGVYEHAFNTHISLKQNEAMTNKAMFADSLRALVVDVSLDKGEYTQPAILNTDQPGLGGESF